MVCARRKLEIWPVPTPGMVCLYEEGKIWADTLTIYFCANNLVGNDFTTDFAVVAVRQRGILADHIFPRRSSK